MILCMFKIISFMDIIGRITYNQLKHLNKNVLKNDKRRADYENESSQYCECGQVYGNN